MSSEGARTGRAFLDGDLYTGPRVAPVTACGRDTTGKCRHGAKVAKMVFFTPVRPEEFVLTYGGNRKTGSLRMILRRRTWRRLFLTDQVYHMVTRFSTELFRIPKNAFDHAYGALKFCQDNALPHGGFGSPCLMIPCDREKVSYGSVCRHRHLPEPSLWHIRAAKNCTTRGQRRTSHRTLRRIRW